MERAGAKERDVFASDRGGGSDRRGQRDSEAYVEWQRQRQAEFGELDQYGLAEVLHSAEASLPEQPERSFMAAWMEACKPGVAEMPVRLWMTVWRLGGLPDREHVRLIDAAAEEDKGKHAKAIGSAEMNGVVAPSDVEAWISVLLALLRLAVAKEDTDTFWGLLEWALTIGAEDLSRVAVFLDTWAGQKPLIRSMDDNSIARVLRRLSQVGYQPPASWVSDMVAELVRRLPLMKENHSMRMFLAMSRLANPERHSEAVGQLVAAWIPTCVHRVQKWPNYDLVKLLAALVRLRAVSSPVCKQWCEQWLEVGRRHLEGGKDGWAPFDLIDEDLEAACMNVARKLNRFHRPDPSMSLHENREIMLYQLEDMHALGMRDSRGVAKWLDHAMSVLPFRRHEIAIAAKLLRELGARKTAEQFERANNVAF